MLLINTFDLQQQLLLPSGLSSLISDEIMIGDVLQLSYFDDPLVFCLLTLDSIDSKDLQYKSEFFDGFVQYIPYLSTVSASDMF